jgi:hypothetical protein
LIFLVHTLHAGLEKSVRADRGRSEAMARKILKIIALQQSEDSRK